MRFSQDDKLKIFSNLPSALLLAKIISLARLCVIEEYRKNVLSVLYDALSNLKNFRTILELSIFHRE